MRGTTLRAMAKAAKPIRIAVIQHPPVTLFKLKVNREVPAPVEFG